MLTYLSPVVNVFSGFLIPLDHRQFSRPYTMRWVANAIQSPTGAPFIYTMLTSIALTSQNSAREIFEYKTNAISAINAQLRDPRSCVDDNNIAAVLMLLSLEEMKTAGPTPESDWSKQQLMMHLTGLKSMIQKRGGLAALGSNQCLQTFLLMQVFLTFHFESVLLPPAITAFRRALVSMPSIDPPDEGAALTAH